MTALASLRAQDLSKSFDRDGTPLTVLSGVDVSIEAGECVSIVGVSGVGKSTLLHCLGGLERPSSGRVWLGSEDLYGLSDGRRATLRNREIGFVFQFHHLLADFTAVENVVLPQLIGGEDRAVAHARALELFRRVGLADRTEHRPGELSGGEQQRVAIARALACRPGILLTDEPTGNLDEATAVAVHDLLLSLNEELGTTLVYVTHNPEFAATARRRLRLHLGRLEEM
ncbi:MAG: ABC transporter ATP-binding protein [Nitrospirota bacterium]